jgi:hypothetical protein
MDRDEDSARLERIEEKLDALISGDAAKIEALRLKLQQARVPLAAAVAQQTKGQINKPGGKS